MSATSTLFKKSKPGICIEGAVYCRSCFEKQRRIDELEGENTRLKAKLRYREGKDKEAYFGSSTPSSKKPFKPNAQAKEQKKQGGAVNGHPGHSRQMFGAAEADEVITYEPLDEVCPDCGGALELKEIDERAVVEGQVLKPKKLLFRCHTKRCVDCRKVLRRAAPVLPRHKYGTQFLSNAVLMHYLHGIPMKRVEDIWGSDVVAGNLIKNFHELAELFSGMLDRISEEYRRSPVKHADETGWRTDGHNGYSWLFNSADTSLFRFEQTRSSSVVGDTLGKKRLPGVLVVDRYAAYNKAPCRLQYCYAHLLRKVKDAQKDFPKESEVKGFVETVAPLLSKAMSLRAAKISDKAYYEQAKQLKKEIMAAMNSPGKHPAVVEIQDIFREKTKRLFHWVKNRAVPADNNRAERELRPTVIARKVSFGSQSKRGAKTRSVLMSVLHTVAKRLPEGQSVEDWLNGVLQDYIHDPKIDFASLLPPKPT